jgi:hypothetical protein
VAGDEDDRQYRMPLVQFHLQFQPAHAGHADVEHEAAGAIVTVRVEEFLAGLEDFDGQSD